MYIGERLRRSAADGGQRALHGVEATNQTAPSVAATELASVACGHVRAHSDKRSAGAPKR